MEFREMRRKRQQLAEEEIAILEKATTGTLALLGDNDYRLMPSASAIRHLSVSSRRMMFSRRSTPPSSVA